MQPRKTVLLCVTAAAVVAGIAAAGRIPLLGSAHTRHPRSGAALTVPGKDGTATLLFNGWRVQPAGRSLPSGDMPLGGALSPDGRTFAIANCGYARHEVHLIDVATEREFETFPVEHAWNGIAWAPNSETFYVAGGVSSDGKDIHVFTSTGDRWERHGTIRLNGPKEQSGRKGESPCVSGLALSPDGRTLFALNTNDGRLYVVNTESEETVGALEVGDHPVVCRLTPDGRSLLVANWGGKEIVRIDVSAPERPAVEARFATGEHPNDLAIGKDGRLFVSCGNSDAIFVHDVKTGATLETLKTGLTPQAPSGSTPNALALAPDGRTLYVATAGNNAICALDVSTPGGGRVRGFIPTGWYPTAVGLTADGRKLIVGSGKGLGTHPNPGIAPEHPTAPAQYRFQYIGEQLGGLISFVDAPSDAELARYSALARTLSPYRDARRLTVPGAPRTAIPAQVGQPSPIKYVLYIIKENRTYDQVFGDMPRGNGDPNLCLFGRDVTPNQHALADQYVLLDNLYCSGEVSEDGHPWCDGAIANDYIERDWVLSYSGKGSVRETEEMVDPGAGWLWDACRKAGISFRSYGEALNARSSREAPTPQIEGAKGLIGHGSERYVGIGWQKGREFRDTDKADIFIEEFRQFEKEGRIPKFTVMSLGEDHTRGTRPGSHTPKSCVAANDVAIGKIVDAISHSSVWGQFAIFIIEDDAQNGPDHVDAHRTMGLVISPYAKRHAVDSTMYSTTSMVRTMELILGLPPLTEYDASSTPMFNSFADRPDLAAFTALPARIDLAERNTKESIGAAASARLDFSAYDRADAGTLNRILWQSVKGPGVPMPSSVHRIGAD